MNGGNLPQLRPPQPLKPQPQPQYKPQQAPQQPPQEKYRLKPTSRINEPHPVHPVFSMNDRSGWFLLYLVIAAILGLVFLSLYTPCGM
jgi:hypothetical protein